MSKTYAVDSPGGAKPFTAKPKSTKGSPKPTLPPCPPWRYAAHPHRWSVSISQGRLVPALAKISTAPGHSHVTEHGNTDYQTTKYEGRGWVFIPYDVEGPGTSYVMETPVSGGTAYVESHCTTVPGSSHVYPDTEAFDAFRVSLIDKGLVPEPAMHVAQRLRDRLERTLGWMAKNPNAQPQRLVDDVKARLDIVQRYLNGDDKKAEKPTSTKSTRSTSK